MLRNSRLLSLILFCLVVNFSNELSSQESLPAWVFFTDKDENHFQPEAYFSPSALERRSSIGLNPTEKTDLPIRQDYLSSVSELAIEYCGSSRWLNAAMVLATEEQIRELQKLPFVEELILSSIEITVHANIESSVAPEIDWELANQQLAWHDAQLLRENDINGKGIRIAVFDGGFPGVDTHPGFSHLFHNQQIIQTWDFASKSPNVYKSSPHGTAVLSCIAGIADKVPTGMAPNAEFLLARTELRAEPWKEELYWIQAAEWADKNGAHIISSSLGYNYHRYFVRDMTGRDTPVALAADIAASKGILVINCMGNEGKSKWKYAVTPADADSVLSVGGIDPVDGIHIGFSSYGPNMSGQMKPNVVASGEVLCASTDGWKTAFGTSFSAPLIAGFAACVWQLNPQMNNMEIFNLIQKSGHLYPYYDFAHGYGIPKASTLLNSRDARDLKKNEIVKVSLRENDIEIEFLDEDLKKSPATDNYLYYHLRDTEDEIVRYGVFLIDPKLPLNISYSDTPEISSIYLRYRDNFKIIKLQLP